MLFCCHFKFWHNRKNGLQSTWNYLNGQTRFRIMGTGDYSLVNTHYVIMSTSTHNQQKFPTIFFYSITTNPILVPDSHLPHYQLRPLKWLLGRLLKNYIWWHVFRWNMSYCGKKIGDFIAPYMDFCYKSLAGQAKNVYQTEIKKRNINWWLLFIPSLAFWQSK